MKTNKTPGKNDAYVDAQGKRVGWVKTQIVETTSGDTKRAVVLVECDVSDPNRFCFLNGAWWRFESSD